MRDPATKPEWLQSLRGGQRQIIFPLICWLGVIACVIWIVAGLSGCATATEELRVCYVQLIGKTDGGVFVEAQRCMSPEAFETQQ